jgi:hypothetical protein
MALEVREFVRNIQLSRGLGVGFRPKRPDGLRCRDSASTRRNGGADRLHSSERRKTL